MTRWKATVGPSASCLHWDGEALLPSFTKIALDAANPGKGCRGRIRQLCDVTVLRGSSLTSDRQQDFTVYPHMD
ncbi:hypothetical protein E2C01_084937 [Portunus trituberculatus]|uniref:Uncharacterized protein n=1 Tax=Portunus trituberculatus TaxID=210409 RepID=A0A5B7IWM9_PORTR|nr:hypothetical protein [Portunus trituberculatus]